MTPEEKAAADKAEADKKEADRVASANQAAQDAANKEPLVVEGDAKLGGPFSIHGTGFGTQGALIVGGQVVKTTSWTDHRIKGVMPAGLSGDVVLKGAFGERRGKWPYVRPVSTTTTTTTVVKS